MENFYNSKVNEMLNDFKEHVHAEDEEEDSLKLYINGSIAYVKNMINRNYDELDVDEVNTFNMCVFMVATNWYLNRDGSSKGASNNYASINPMIQSLRVPPIGGGQL